MTTHESRGHDPDVGGALRGAVLILVVGAALGVAYNAIGLASRPRHGLAWIKSTPKLESLEAIQAAAGTAEPAGSPVPAASGTAAGRAARPAPAAASSGTSKPEPSKPAPTEPGVSRRTNSSPAAAASPEPAGKRPGDATAAGPARAAASPAPASGDMPPVSAGPAPTGPATTPAAVADLPVIPDVPGPLKLEIATLKRLHDANAALVLDAREAAEYAEGHISGAISLPYNDAMAEPERVKSLDPAGRPIVVYCSGGDCELSRDLAKVLVEAGKRKVLIYEGGFPEWQGAGYAVARGPNP